MGQGQRRRGRELAGAVQVEAGVDGQLLAVAHRPVAHHGDRPRGLGQLDQPGLQDVGAERGRPVVPHLGRVHGGAGGGSAAPKR